MGQIIPFLTAVHNSNTPDDHATHGYFQLITAGFIPPGYVGRNVLGSLTHNQSSVSILFEESGLFGIIDSVGNYNYRVNFGAVPLPTPPHIDGSGFPSTGVEKRYLNRAISLEHTIAGEGDLKGKSKYLSSPANGSIAIKLAKYAAAACAGGSMPAAPGDPGVFEFTYIIHAIFTGTLVNSSNPAETISVTDGEYYYTYGHSYANCPVNPGPNPGNPGGPPPASD